MENLARWQLLGKALQVSEPEPHEVIVALKVALSQRKRLLTAKRKEHGDSNCVVDNRAIWVCAIVEGLGSVKTNVVKAFSKIVPTLCGLLRIRTGHELL